VSALMWIVVGLLAVGAIIFVIGIVFYPDDNSF